MLLVNGHRAVDMLGLDVYMFMTNNEMTSIKIKMIIYVINVPRNTASSENLPNLSRRYNY